MSKVNWMFIDSVKLYFGREFSELVGSLAHKPVQVHALSTVLYNVFFVVIINLNYVFALGCFN